MSKTFSVVFGADNARIIVGQEIKSPNAVINPDLSAVKDLPPHEWALVDGKVVPKGTPSAEVKENRSLWVAVIIAVALAAAYLVFR